MKCLALLAGLVASASATIYYAGVAESSGEFGVWSENSVKGTGLPGTFGKEYAFIDEKGVATHVDENGVNLFRLAFLLERMCPLSSGLGATFDETHFQHFKDAVDYITITKGAYCILDPHNYMRYNDPSHQPFTGSIIGDASDPEAATTAQFGAFWGELAKRFKDNEKVIFGLMNEPHDMKSALLLANLQAAVDGIRASGAENLILAPGNSWTGGHSWTEGGAEASASWMDRLVDPAKNVAIEVHEYLDQDFSGGHSECAQAPAHNLDGVTRWLREHEMKGFILEFGGNNNTGCANMLDDLLTYMEDNPEWIGWTGWAAGPFWGPNSPCCTDQKQFGSFEPGSKAADGSPGLYETVWKKVIQPHVPKLLQWDGPATVNGGELTERKAM